ncbi:MAG: cupin domain-containing protein [Ginsengibacter sp.]|jgi:mannose-6-phosphate isomerase-like protein (cupin superfamily)
MKRRNFLQNSLTALAATSVAVPSFSQSIPGKKAFKVKALQTRYKDKVVVANAPIDFKLLSSDTEDRLSVFISSNNQKGFGPPLHIHHSFDEFFCILNGMFLFQVDDEILSLKNGDTLFIPRNVKHCFTYNGKTSGTLLVGMLPGKGMENYFKEMGKLLTGQGMPDMPSLQTLFKSYDSEILGPPMKG